MKPQKLRQRLSVFARATPGVDHAVIVSTDGCPLAAFPAEGPAGPHPLAAVTASIGGLATAVASREPCDRYNILIDFSGGYLLISTLGEHALLGVVAAKGASLGAVAYQMTRFIAATRPALARRATVIDVATSAAEPPIRTQTG